jgi:predicted DNA-binding transcriptional regulator AlpA
MSRRRQIDLNTMSSTRCGTHPHAHPQGDKVTGTQCVPRISDPLLLTAAEAASLFRIKLRTLRTWDTMGHIPQPVRIGRRIFWRPNELKAWVAAGCPDREMWEVLKN